MSRLLVFADIHGSLSAWLTVGALLAQGDSLAIAGDLFDTRYGSYGNPDFQPDHIRSDLTGLPHPLYYVYGNCDVERYCPGYHHESRFQIFGKKIFLHHGHRPLPDPGTPDIIIQGHTHLCHLEKKGDVIHMNPGSIPRPRNKLSTYGIVEPEGASLVDLKSGDTIAAIPFG